jgi:hypothetical protein
MKKGMGIKIMMTQFIQEHRRDKMTIIKEGTSLEKFLIPVAHWQLRNDIPEKAFEFIEEANRDKISAGIGKSNELGFFVLHFIFTDKSQLVWSER